jgi:hypothetical protein
MTRQAARLIHRLLMWLLGVSGAIGAALAVLVTFLAWQLSQGPISLDFLTPYLARALNNAEPGITVAIDHTRLSFSSESKLELMAEGVHVTQGSGATLSLPAFYIGLSAHAALRGVIAPTRITLDGPTLRLQRDSDGKLHVGLGSDAVGVSDDLGTRLLADLVKAPDREGPLGHLVEVGIHNASLTVDDRSLDVVWRAERADIVAHRGADGLRSEARLTADIGGQKTELDGVLSYRIASGTAFAVLRFRDLRPSAWAAARGFAPLAVGDVPVSGELRASFDVANKTLRDASCDLAFGAGELHNSAFVGGKLPVARGTLQATYDPSAGRIDVAELSVDIGGPKLSVAGTVDGLGSGLLDGAAPQLLTVASRVQLEGLPVDDFAALWPAGLSPGTREFLTQQVHAGRLDRAEMNLGLHVDLRPTAAKTLQVDTLSGNFAYTNLTVDYFPPLPSVSGVNGTATFTRQRVDFAPASGVIKGVRVSGGAIALTKLDTNDEQVGIDLGMSGPLRDLLEVLDSKPLRYAHEIGIEPGNVDGTFDSRIRFAFPLVKKLAFSRVDYGAQATLANVGIKQIMFGRDLTGGDLKLQLDRSAMQLEGKAALGGNPLTVTWSYSLKPSSPVVARYVVHTQLDEAGRQALGVDVAGDRLGGPIGVDLDYSLSAGRKAEATVALDLKQTTMSLAELGWKKTAGTPANARLRLQLQDDHLTAIREATVKGGGLDAEIAASFAPDANGSSLTRLEIARLSVGKTNLMGSVTPRASGGWRVQLTGASFDATAMLARDHDPDHKTASSHVGPPLAIDASFDRLILGDKREATAVRGALFRDGGHWEAASVDLGMAGGGTASLRFGKAGGDHSFKLTSSDYGALLKLLDVTDTVRGGNVELAGRVDDTDGERVLRGHATGSDYRIVGAPMFARLLSVASFAGIGALLSGEGIPFNHLSADFTYDGGKISVTDMRVNGSAIGINASGTIDFDGGTLDVNGTLVPAYSLNSVLGNVPVLGKLLLGGEGQGIFGANFRVSGTLDDPKISVNALSTIAPGALRNLFLFDAPSATNSRQSAAGATTK